MYVELKINYTRYKRARKSWLLSFTTRHTND